MKLIHQKWLTEFLDNCRHLNRSQHTVINYRADLIKFIIWYEFNFAGNLNHANAKVISDYKAYLQCAQVGSFPVTNTKNGLFNRFLHFFKRKIGRSLLIPPSLTRPLAVASRRRHLSSIKNFYEYLKQTNEDFNKLFPLNPVKSKLHNIRLKEQDVKNTVLLAKSDWRAIQQEVYRPNERLIVALLYYGGLRLSELSQLRADNFNAEFGYIKFNRKGGYVHKLHIHNKAKIFDLLSMHLVNRQNHSEFIFTGRGDGHISSRAMYNLIMKIFQKGHCETTGLTPHSFRKACATNLYQKTKDLLYVRDYLNHSDAQVTQTYIDL